MHIVYYIPWSIILILTILPLFRFQHWIFRVPDFGKVQLMVSCIIVFLLAFLFKNTIAFFWIFQIGLLLIFLYHAIVIFRYTSYFPLEKKSKTSKSSDSIRIISCNVYQFNKEKNRFIRIKDIKKPVVVVGDFNNVAWAKTSVLFRKAAELIDPRIGRGLIATFHAKYKLFRFPIDHIFHTSDIFVEDIKTLEHVGSNHFPLFCQFWIDKNNDEQDDETDTTDAEENEEVDELIKEGKAEDGDRSQYE